MNKKYRFTLRGLMLLALAGFMGACEDSLIETPNSSYDTNRVFENLDNAQMALMGSYASLAGTDHFGQMEMAMYTSDDMYLINGTTSDNTRRDIAHYMVSTDNTWVRTLWSYKYDGLNRANYVIQQVEAMDEFKNGEADALRIVGEARFLRALLSFDLIRYWGDVPYKTVPTLTYDDAYLPRTDRAEIYDQIIEDLNMAKESLAWATAGANTENATQGAARALLMRVYLHRAGYSLNMSGEMVCPDDATRATYFQAAIAEFEAIEANGFHELNADVEQLWINYCAEIVEPKESMFEIAMYTPDGNKGTASTYATYIGPIIDSNSSYGRANGFFRVLPEWKAFYHADDARNLLNNCSWSINANDEEVATSSKTVYPGKWRRNWCTGAMKDPNNTDVNFVYLRYADVVLMAAEAYNETGNSNEAVKQINRVRTRSNAPELDLTLTYDSLYKAPQVYDLEFISDADDAGKVRTALYWERGFELAFEGTRKYDLLRWNVLPDAIKLFSGTALGTGYAAPSNFTTGKHELFPIPLLEIQVNAELNNLNNPGY